MAVYRTDKTKTEILSAFQNNKRVIVKGILEDQQNNIKATSTSQFFLTSTPEVYDEYYILSSSFLPELVAQENDEYFYYNSNNR